jgi:hypothetical protein
MTTAEERAPSIANRNRWDLTYQDLKGPRPMNLFAQSPLFPATNQEMGVLET